MKIHTNKRFLLGSAAGVGVLALVMLGAFLGYEAGQQRAHYITERGRLFIHLSSNAKIDSGKFDAIRSDNDALVTASYWYLRSSPRWVRLLDRREPRSDSKLQQRAQLLKESLDHRRATITLAEAEEFVRTYMR